MVKYNKSKLWFDHEDNHVFPLCNTCVHYDRNRNGPPTCKAFPDGIPKEILKGFDHRKEWPGDGGTRYEEEEKGGQ